MARIGFVGTGIMGTPMVMNLIKGGHQVQVWNRTFSKLKGLEEVGAKACHQLSEVGKDVDLLVVMLSDGKTCDEVLFQQDGAVSELKKNSIVIVMSSIPVKTAKHQNERCLSLGLRYLDAPVSGGEKGAKDATLAIMVGGEEDTFTEAQAVLNCMGRAVLVGAAGCGELAKLVNQMIVASTIATVAEGLLFAQQGGADPQKVKQALTGGFADSPILQQHGERILRQNFKPGGAATTQLKDTHTAINYAQELNLKLPVAELVNQLFSDMVHNGDGALDHSGLIREIKRLNNIEI
ncbi:MULTISPECIES: NAD(P)-dependent oxidoreductase [Acinetobacter]|uniref:NAD(P)-dependent oxidoreductase n=1 Tax=Acinetobacter variabilis TaxID=70346 RepID=A0A7T7WJ92_9GAMM|nr:MULTISPECIES: NAD(P)-dependent oxidoreductase [Acinetobacter]MCU4630905.1 NAD(P)-dependent oxidoreductase [Acinetobacter variabilis]QQN88761.1 NAD(P)-dependent oxidoreductase [Acinetobacter variabilis]